MKSSRTKREGASEYTHLALTSVLADVITNGKLSVCVHAWCYEASLHVCVIDFTLKTKHAVVLIQPTSWDKHTFFALRNKFARQELYFICHSDYTPYGAHQNTILLQIVQKYRKNK